MKVRNLCSAAYLVACLLLTLEAHAQSPPPALRVGDIVKLRSGEYQGSVVKIEGGNVTLQLTVPSVQLIKTTVGMTVSPNAKYAGTWQSHDRILVIYDEKKFRILWEADGRLNINDGTYKLSDSNVFSFQPKEGEAWPWRLDSFQPQAMKLSHEFVGSRTFSNRAPSKETSCVGTWDVTYTTNFRRSGTAKLYLYRDGVYLVYEYDGFGNFDHYEYGVWSAKDANSLSLTFYYRNAYHTVDGSRQQSAPDNFVWTFTSLRNEKYTYRCKRKKKD